MQLFTMVFDSSFAAASPAFSVTEYFAKSCPHCVHMEPVWAKAVSVGADSVAWNQKECYAEGWAPGKDLDACKADGVDAFPTIVMHKTGTNESWVAPQLDGNTVEDRAQQLVDFVKSHAETTDIKQSSVLHLAAAASLIIPNLWKSFL